MSGRERELAALLSSASLVLVGTVFGSLSTLLERVIIGRSLSLAAYGEVSIGISVLTVTTSLALFGFSQGIPRFMSRDDDERRARGAWMTGLAVTAVVALVVTVVLFAGADVLTARLLERTESPRLVRLFVLAVPLLVGLHVGVGAIRGLENTVYKTLVQDLLYPVVRILCLVGLLTAGYGVLAAGYAYVVAAAVGFVAAHLLLNRLLSLRGEFALRTREMVGFSAPLVVTSVLSMLLVQTDTLMLGAMRSSDEVALYSAAYPLAYGLFLVLTAFGFIYLPLASRLDADGERAEIDAIYKVTTKWIYVVTFPAFLAFAVFPRDVLTVFFGARYADGAPALVILSLGFFTNAAAGRNRQTMSALGHTRTLMYCNVLAYAANVALNVILIRAYGFAGAAVASAASYVTLNAAVTGVLRGRFGISPFSSAGVRTFVVLPATFVPLAWLLSRAVTLTVVTLPVFLVVAGLLSLVVVAVAGGLQPEDRVAVEFVEERTGVRIPLVRRYIPDFDDADVPESAA
jgi:O-antigen/teichoic acid export membrane protein